MRKKSRLFFIKTDISNHIIDNIELFDTLTNLCTTIKHFMILGKSITDFLKVS